MIKLFWKVYYFFKPIKKQEGKTEFVRMMARVNGWKITEIKVEKVK